MLKKYGKKMIGWDEILEGGLSPEATVMSWRGEKGGIAAAMMNHEVIMTPVSGGVYLDHYQGDPLVEQFAWGGYAPISKTYAYDPVPDTLTAMGKEKYVLGVQGNAWSECMYTEAKVEYQVYPRILAVAEVGWSLPENKNFEDFSRRLNRAAVCMDLHQVNYHIPLPEQPGGSFSHIAFTDTTQLIFKTTRPVEMVYTTDGTEPDLSSPHYAEPLHFNTSGLLKIRSILPSGKMSRVRSIELEKQQMAVPFTGDIPQREGLSLKIADAKCLSVSELSDLKTWKDSTLTDLKAIAHLRPNFYSNVVYYAAIAQGFVQIPEDGIYQFKSDNTRVWINGAIAADNDGKPQVNSRYDRSMALHRGWYPIKVEQISNFIGGWNSQHRNTGNVYFKKSDKKEWERITPELIRY